MDTLKNESSTPESVGPPFSPYFDFAGRIKENHPKSFQYRMGVKVYPPDMKVFVKKYKLDD